MSSGKVLNRSKSSNAVVGTGGSVFEGDAESSPGGRADRGGGGGRQEKHYDGQLLKRGGYCSKHNLRDRDQSLTFL